MKRYCCETCGYRDKWIPGRPDDLPRTIRSGCPECGQIKRLKKVGVP